MLRTGLLAAAAAMVIGLALGAAAPANAAGKGY